MLKLVFTDLDGTFVDSQKLVPERNARVLDLAAERGVQFVPCTGRNANGILPELANHPAVRYAICCNGALVVDLREDRVLRSAPMSNEQVLELYERVRNLRVSFDVFINGKVYLERSRWEIPHEASGGDRAAEKFFYSLRTPYDCSLEELLQRGPATKVTMLHPGNIDAAAVRAAAESVKGVEWTWSLPMNTEVANAEASKGAALAWLCGHLGVDVADAVAFGDGDNDLSMIRAAGDGVAMANAIPEVLAAADHVTSSCDEAGVAAYLEPILSAMA